MLIGKNVWVLTGLLLTSYVAIWWVKSGYQFTIAEPPFQLREIPLALDDWQGHNVEIIDGTVEVLNAHEFINRVYVDPIGREISVHAATWCDEQNVGQATPHHPQVCYPAAGWEIIDRRRDSFHIGAEAFPVEWMLVQGGERSIVIGHWYEMGERRFTAADEGIAAFCSMWGAPIWPSTIKFLVQTDSSSINDSQQMLAKFCAAFRNTLPMKLSAEAPVTESLTGTQTE